MNLIEQVRCTENFAIWRQKFSVQQNILFNGKYSNTEK